ncbi:MAG: FAD-dependent oxidoreductase [Arcicella sp.]|nr:FAD-dependent oxidoreductase [Arcicella sp.]
MKTIIIGAGMAGLSAARILSQKGHEVVVLDKGRGVGGRMSTRTIDTAKADHGAQYFSVKSPEFQELIADLQAENIIAEWIIPQRANVRYVGARGMNTIPKRLAQNLNVLVNEKVIFVSENEVKTEAGNSYLFDNLIITIPIPQITDLLNQSHIKISSRDQSVFESIRYSPSIAVMAVLNQPTNIVGGGIMLENQPVAWIADNFQKGITQTPTATLHANGEYSAEHFDNDLQIVAKEILASVNQYIKPDNIQSFQVHRWKFSNATERYEKPFYQLENQNIFLGGDGFGIGNVEGAFLSGYYLGINLSH